MPTQPHVPAAFGGTNTWVPRLFGSPHLPATRREPRVFPEELPNSEPPARGGCWHQSARLWWQNREGPAPASASCVSHGSAPTCPRLAYLTLSAIHSPHQQELCHRRPAHLALKDIGDTAGRAKLSGQTDDELHDDAGGGRGGPEMLPDRAMRSLLQVSSSILLKNMSYLLNLSLGQSKINFYSLSPSCLHAGEVVIRHTRALPSALALGSAVHL